MTRADPGDRGRSVLILALAAACAAPVLPAWGALLAGAVLAVFGVVKPTALTKAVGKYAVQACVVLLGFRLDLHALGAAAADGFVLAAATIVGTLLLAWALGQLLRVGGELTTLVGSGTAICGASAIAAVGAAIRAAPASIAVATGAIFLLNALGLVTLPAIGVWSGLSARQFGTWAGIALHDVASVAAAGSAYPGDGAAQALDTANVVKMTRVLWIIPLAGAAAWWASRARAGEGAGKGRAPIPWFIALFLLASGVRTMVPSMESHESMIRSVAGAGFRSALFLIGTGLTMAALRSVGWRVLAQAAVLWVAVAGASWAAVRAFVEP